jgi:aryl-alcohol dehydrogenase-like predicted oxidoreductase
MATVGLGCVKLGNLGDRGGRSRANTLINHAIDLGVTHFDTADAYGAGSSERALGEAVRDRRDQVTLATKGGYGFTERGGWQVAARAWAAPFVARVRRLRRPVREGGSGGRRGAYQVQDFSPSYLSRALEGSLRRLQVEHIDLYQLHAPRLADHEEVAGWAAAMIESGKIGELGLGAETLDQAEEWKGVPIVTSVQLPLGLIDPEAGDTLIPSLHASGRTVIARGVLGAGLLHQDPSNDPSDVNAFKSPLIASLQRFAADTGIGINRLALGFVAARPDVDIILVGTTSPAHLDDLVDAASTPLDSETIAELDSIIERWRGAVDDPAATPADQSPDA